MWASYAASGVACSRSRSRYALSISRRRWVRGQPSPRDDSALPLEPTPEEMPLVLELGPGGIVELDRALLAAVRGQWSETARVILRALDHLGRSPPGSAHVAVAARR